MRTLALVSVAVLLLALTLAAKDNDTLTVELKNAAGESVGAATLTRTADIFRTRSGWHGGKGVDIKLDLHNLPPGEHGIHIHRDPVCQPPDFMTAGGHINPENKKHGQHNPEGPHAGDVGNITVGKDGIVRTTIVAKYAKMEQLYAGRSLVIHANADDEMTDPTGNSGARIACGVIAAVKE